MKPSETMDAGDAGEAGDTGAAGDRRDPEARLGRAAGTRAEADRLGAAVGVLAEPHRLLMLRLLRRGARTAGFLADAVGVSAPTASHHLAVLAEAGLVERRASGSYACYAVRKEALRDLHAGLGRFAGASGAAAGAADEAGPCAT